MVDTSRTTTLSRLKMEKETQEFLNTSQLFDADWKEVNVFPAILFKMLDIDAFQLIYWQISHANSTKQLNYIQSSVISTPDSAAEVMAFTINSEVTSKRSEDKNPQSNTKTPANTSKSSGFTLKEALALPPSHSPSVSVADVSIPPILSPPSALNQPMNFPGSSKKQPPSPPYSISEPAIYLPLSNTSIYRFGSLSSSRTNQNTEILRGTNFTLHSKYATQQVSVQSPLSEHDDNAPTITSDDLNEEKGGLPVTSGSFSLKRSLSMDDMSQEIPSKYSRTELPETTESARPLAQSEMDATSGMYDTGAAVESEAFPTETYTPEYRDNTPEHYFVEDEQSRSPSEADDDSRLRPHHLSRLYCLDAGRHFCLACV